MSENTMNLEKLDFAKQGGLIPGVVQDASTRQVLMLGYFNQEALQKTISTGEVTFWSRSKQALWTKGETSGNKLQMVEMKADCDNDTILVFANPTGPVCHRNTTTCFDDAAWVDRRQGDPISSEGDYTLFLSQLMTQIEHRRDNAVEGSYTRELFDSGVNRIAQKVGEEATEVVVAALGEEEKLVEESADLIYHLFVLLAERNISLKEVVDVLVKRSGYTIRKPANSNAHKISIH